MKAFVIVWLAAMWILLIVGWGWYYADRKSEKRKKTPMILLAIGSLMMAVLFLGLLTSLKK